MTVHQRMRTDLIVSGIAVASFIVLLGACFMRPAEAAQLPFDVASTQKPPACPICEDGKDGAPGRDGVDGQDGAPGPEGPPGKDGRDGEDGVCTSCQGWTPGPIHMDGVFPFALPPDMQWASIVQPDRRWDVVGFSPLFQAMLIVDRANNRFIVFDRSSSQEAYWRWMVPSSPNSILTFGDSYVYPGKGAVCDVDIPKLLQLASRPGKTYFNWTSFGAPGASDLASHAIRLPESIWREAEREVQP